MKEHELDLCGDIKKEMDDKYPAFSAGDIVTITFKCAQSECGKVHKVTANLEYVSDDGCLFYGGVFDGGEYNPDGVFALNRNGVIITVSDPNVIIAASIARMLRDASRNTEHKA